MQTLRARGSNIGKRADVLLSEHIPQFSRAALKSLFEEKLVTLNGKPVKAGYKLKKNDSLKVDSSRLKTKPEEIELPIIYEDSSMLAMDKPAGILTHSKGAINSEATVASFLSSKISDKNLGGNRAGIIHRLDRGTSGVIIGAKNEKTLKWFQKQFSQRKTNKVYLAVVQGIPNPESAIIDVPIGRNPKKPQTFKVISEGKPAQTTYKVVKSFKKAGKDYSLVELTPATGRTHQLRVHLAYIGNPIVGDSLYGKDDTQPMLLHAASLGVSMPEGGKKTFKAKLPAAFSEFDA